MPAVRCSAAPHIALRESRSNVKRQSCSVACTVLRTNRSTVSDLYVDRQGCWLQLSGAVLKPDWRVAIVCRAGKCGSAAPQLQRAAAQVPQLRGHDTQSIYDRGARRIFNHLSSGVEASPMLEGPWCTVNPEMSAMGSATSAADRLRCSSCGVLLPAGPPQPASINTAWRQPVSLCGTKGCRGQQRKPFAILAPTHAKTRGAAWHWGEGHTGTQP